jgi:hypothetical protein
LNFSTRVAAIAATAMQQQQQQMQCINDNNMQMFCRHTDWRSSNKNYCTLLFLLWTFLFALLERGLRAVLAARPALGLEAVAILTQAVALLYAALDNAFVVLD